MTDTFIYTEKRESELFKVILEIMNLGMCEQERDALSPYIPFLNLVDNYISYYQKKNAAEINIPIFYMPNANDDMRSILSKYLTIRLGILTPKTISSLRKDVDSVKKYGLIIPTAGTPKSKEFNKKIHFAGKITKFGYALATFKSKIVSISSSLSDLDDSGYNILVCKDQDVCDGRNSLLIEFFEKTYKGDKTLYINSSSDASELKNSVHKYHKAFEDSEYGNAYMIYSNSNRFKSFSKGRWEQVSQLGFNVKNFFVFVLTNCHFSTGRIVADKARFERIFNVGKNNKQFFFPRYEEILNLNPNTMRPNYQRYYSQTNENDDILRSEIALMLDGVRYPSSKRNILSLCVLPSSQEFFLNYLEEEDPDYQRLNHPVVFNYIQNQWENEFRNKILSFINYSTKSFAIVIDGFTPPDIKNDMTVFFQGYDIHFYRGGDLKPTRGGNQIREKFIVVIRCMRYYKEASIYPNSYDPYVLREDQSLLEILNVPIFKNKIDISNYELSATFNNLFDSDYRKDVLGWKSSVLSRPSGDNDTGYYMEYNSGDNSYSQSKLLIVTSDGKKRTVPESELLIVEEDGHIELARASELYDEFEGKRIQLASDLENHLSPFIERSANKDSSLETEIRRQFIPEIGDSAVKSKEELWRLLLEWKVLQLGEEKVYKDVIENQGITLKINAFKNWYSFEYPMILPRDRQCIDSVFKYLGFEIYGTYYIIMRRKKIRQKNSTRSHNNLLDELLSEIFKYAENEITYNDMEQNIPDSLDLIGIDSEDFLDMVKDDVLSQLNLKEIKQIKRYGE